jgi:hypothetical protein
MKPMTAEDNRNPHEIIRDMQMCVTMRDNWKTLESASFWTAHQIAEMARLQLGIAKIQEHSAKRLERVTLVLGALTVGLLVVTVLDYLKPQY